MTPAPRDEMGWPVVMIGGERVCASGMKCYHLCILGDGTALRPMTEFRIDGYCSCECRDFDEMRQDHATALLSEADAARAKADVMQQAINAFVAQYAKCDNAITSAFAIAYTLRGGQYDGPNFAKELDALKALAAQDRAKETG